LRVWESRDGVPGRRTWPLLRRTPDGSELQYAFSNAPHTASQRTLARVSAMRWPGKTEFRQGKGDAGLDEYEVRAWRGWRHHVALSLLASTFLLTLPQHWGEETDPAGRPGAVTRPPVSQVLRDLLPRRR
jgi:SRSO17 transposase